jgi:transposase
MRGTDRPWAGPEPPAAVYFYSPDRKAERPASHLGREGVLQVDGYAGLERLTARGAVVLAACWAHVRRKFYEIYEAMASPIAEQALRHIAALYATEQRIRGRSAEDRRTVRDVESRRLVAAMKPWLEQELGRIPRNGTQATVDQVLSLLEENPGAWAGVQKSDASRSRQPLHAIW